MFTEIRPDFSSEEKYQARVKSWMDPDKVQFASPEAKEAFLEKTRILLDSVELKIANRIPVCPKIGFFPAYYAGITVEEAMYNYDKLGIAWEKYHRDFKPDILASPSLVGPAKVFDALDYRLYTWPGRGSASNTPYQCQESEYMLDHEYDALINDPSDFWMRTYIPRVFGALKPWQMLSPITDIVELPFVGAYLSAIGTHTVQDSFQKLLSAGQMAMEWKEAVSRIKLEILEKTGTPSIFGGCCKAPFDMLGDTLRGTKKIMLDMFRRPEKLLEAMNRLVAINAEWGVRTASAGNSPFVYIPLHKGADNFLSNSEYATFYWPTLKAVILGLIGKGLVPILFAEGSYNQRLEFLTDPEIPPGKTVWFFDSNTDMDLVKQALQGKACFAGNVPGSLLKAGDPAQVEKHIQEMIARVGNEGGFILSTGATIDDVRPENFRAIFESGHKYGRR